MLPFSDSRSEAILLGRAGSGRSTDFLVLTMERVALDADPDLLWLLSGQNDRGGTLLETVVRGFHCGSVRTAELFMVVCVCKSASALIQIGAFHRTISNRPPNPSPPYTTATSSVVVCLPLRASAKKSKHFKITLYYSRVSPRTSPKSSNCHALQCRIEHTAISDDHLQNANPLIIPRSS